MEHIGFSENLVELREVGVMPGEIDEDLHLECLNGKFGTSTSTIMRGILKKAIFLLISSLCRCESFP